jgi:hypothetical protein
MDSKDLGCGRQYLRLRSMGKGDEIYRKTIRLDIGKQNASARMWNIKDWTLWRGRPPPKRLKRESHA